ncbi:MAG: hypothetical protein LBM98_12325 [Oscillospiraceae bacterium]|nr:hypothetical protein [Oscillospiraceae bacterium]
MLRAYTFYVSQALRHFAMTGRAKPCPVSPRNPRSNPRPYPLCGGVPPAGGGVVSRAVRGNFAKCPPPPRNAALDICRLLV